MNYRGYILTETAGGRWLVEHEHYGMELSELPSGLPAMMTWRSRGAAMAAIDRTFEVPHPPPPHEAGVHDA